MAPRQRSSRFAFHIGLVLAGLLACACGVRAAPSTPIAPPGKPVAFSDLPNFTQDDLRPAFQAFRASCAALVAAKAPLRGASPPPAALRAVCAAARQRGVAATQATMRGFFEHHFEPRRIEAAAFFTGYYEPVVDGSPVATTAFPTPLYRRPADLVTIVPGATPGLDPVLNTARKDPNGRLVAMPDRAAIDSGALRASAKPLVYVGSPAEAFFIHVQGSARIRFPNGRLRRLVYDGRNGYPYTSIGKILVARLHVPPSAMGMDQLRGWIRDNGQGAGDAGSKLMQENRSFIFFRFDDTLPANAGPIGGEGLSLTPLRSLAVDRSLWPYGLPFYIDTSLPDATPFRRLMIGQDTGSAILGPSRADIFFGSGPEAARRAGAVRQAGTLYVLWPISKGAKRP